ncbi:hypothetical protein J580_2450 [Acinetobacter sp. 1542444]|nr:hypothetical protein J580_2450 [Acinetobacter sp. 1542444]
MKLAVLYLNNLAVNGCNFHDYLNKQFAKTNFVYKLKTQ